jgi:hypothetical protein
MFWRALVEGDNLCACCNPTPQLHLRLLRRLTCCWPRHASRVNNAWADAIACAWRRRWLSFRGDCFELECVRTRLLGDPRMANPVAHASVR